MDNISVVSEGKITQVIGPVVDVEFADGKLPEIYDAVIVQDTAPNGDVINLTCEVQQLLGENRVRSVAMSSTDGLARGMKVVNTGEPIKVPVGNATLGRILNVKLSIVFIPNFIVPVILGASTWVLTALIIVSLSSFIILTSYIRSLPS